MSSFKEVTVKEEVVAEEEYILEEEDIKVEETRVQRSDYSSFPPTSVIVEKKLSVCSMCKCAFERKSGVKLRNQTDLHKCNKCILHSRLNQVFHANPLKTNWKKGGASSRRKKDREKKRLKTPEVNKNCDDNDDDVLVVGDVTKSKSILVKKVMYVCVHCKSAFERRDAVGLRAPSDWYKCNKCILHSRLNTVFWAGKCVQSGQKHS
jgi:predicted SprT family Zn-dependent metalloprotease